eukprot:6032244-Alexandrium_andersonii.AAC.1
MRGQAGRAQRRGARQDDAGGRCCRCQLVSAESAQYEARPCGPAPPLRVAKCEVIPPSRSPERRPQ